MPRLLVILALLALASSKCIDTCEPQETIKNTPEFRAARTSVAKCLFGYADANKDGKITETEYWGMLKAKKIPTIIQNTIAHWKIVSYKCNCNCEDDPEVTIDWKDINGTEMYCLSSSFIVKQAKDALHC